MSALADARQTSGPAKSLLAIVGFLVVVETASGVLQGFYTPIWNDVAAHLGVRTADINWFEATQLIASALFVPVLARLGDRLGHKRVLLISTIVTAAGSWWLVAAPSFGTFLVGFALQGAYVVWLPLEIAIIHRRTSGDPRQGRLTRRGAAVLVGALELAVIVAALVSGALVGTIPIPALLAIPAAVVTVALVLIWIGIENDEPAGGGDFDAGGLALLVVVLGFIMSGLIVVRLDGPANALPWILIALGFVALVPFVRYEKMRPEPLIDVTLLAERRQWPVQLTAFLIGMSVLGAQIPLSTFARTDPHTAGYGLGAGASFVSILVGVYVIFLAVGAFTLPLTSRLVGERGALVLAAVLVAVGYALWLPFHDSVLQAIVNMAIVGLGTGALVAALPATAAGAAPEDRTGFATGMTNTAKTIGGAIASALFAIALASTGSIADSTRSAPLSGYLTVWSISSATALAAAVVLFASRRDSET
ncbi:MAG: major facilitator superfamily 1 [Frondihabitans sp.]|nr:major facilitator superfamily 1 [Frondihabitans sp.]